MPVVRRLMGIAEAYRLLGLMTMAMLKVSATTFARIAWSLLSNGEAAEYLIKVLFMMESVNRGSPMIQRKIENLLVGDVDIIAHQVNCRGAMGSGVARQIRMNFPGTYSCYKFACAIASSNPAQLLGYTQIFIEEFSDGHKVRIANLFAQDGYGYDGKQYTDYDAFRRCLFQLKLYVKSVEEFQGKKLRIGMPYRIGCARGGGDWNTVYKIIEEELGDLDVTLYELPKK